MRYTNLPTEVAGKELAGTRNDAVTITAEGNPERPLYILTEEDGTRKLLLQPPFDPHNDYWLRDGAAYTTRRCLRELGKSVPEEVPDHWERLRIYCDWFKQRFDRRPVLVEWDGRSYWELLAELDPESAFARYVNDPNSDFGRAYEGNVEIDQYFIDAQGTQTQEN